MLGMGSECVESFEVLKSGLGKEKRKGELICLSP